MSAKLVSSLGIAALAIAACALFAADDPGALKVNITADFDNTKDVYKNPVGIFYEDLGRAADGGLYAELVENRDFEYSAADKEGWDASRGFLRGHAFSECPLKSLSFGTFLGEARKVHITAPS